MLVEKELLKVNSLAKILFIDFGDPYQYRENPIRIELQYEIPNYAVVTPGEIIFVPLLASEVFKGSMGHLGFNTALQSRKYPFRDRSSRTVEISETVKLPVTGEIAYKPEVNPVNEEYASYLGSCLLDGKTLSMKQKIVLGKRVYEASEWPAFRQIVVNQNKMAEEALVVKIIK